jgi:putative FmdB family regulatory protein
MPLYEYECASHGVFELTRPMAEASLGASCPDCATPAPRILSAPRLACLPASQSKAHARNERSRHEPRRVERPARSAPPDAPPVRTKTVAAGGRPWAIGH